MTTAIVFAYHEVGVRCLKVLLAQGVQVPLVVTHRDNAGENIWFDSVAAVARENDIPAITPEDPNLSATVETVAGLHPDFLFSFYFRQMIGPALLAAGAKELPNPAAMARECGFEAAVSTSWGAASMRSDRFQLPRFTPWDQQRWRWGARLLLNLRTTARLA